MNCARWLVAFFLLAFAPPAFAGPPYVSDDPEPTDFQTFEIYAFDAGAVTRDGTDGAGGIDFNYGAAPDLQLTAVFPVAYFSPLHEATVAGFGNVELAARYRVLHQQDVGWDVAVFPRLFLPSGSNAVGEQHFSFLLPVWIGKDWGSWSTFGGGGCEINQGGDSRNFCQIGWVLTRAVLPDLRLGAEIFHRGADARDGKPSTGAGLGVQYDLNDHYHLMGSVNSGLQNAAQTNQLSWYAAMLFTF